MFLVLREIEATGVGKNNSGIVHASGEIIDYHAVEHAALRIFVVYIEIHVRNLIVERSLRNLHLRRFLTHGEHQRPHLRLRNRQYIVLEKERSGGQQQHENNQRPHDAEKRYSGGLHGGKLEIFAEIAESHKRCQKDGKWQSRRHHSERGIEKQLADHTDCQALADKIVDIPPQELHQHNEKTDKKRHHQQRKKPLKHI